MTVRDGTVSVPIQDVEAMATELLDMGYVADPQMRKRAAFMLVTLATLSRRSVPSEPVAVKALTSTFDHEGTLMRVVAILKEFGLPPEGEVDQFEWLRERLTSPASKPEAMCHCDRCQKPVEYDLLVPDDVWARISPRRVDGWKSGGVLCPECIVTALLASKPEVTEAMVDKACDAYDHTTEDAEFANRPAMRAALTAALDPQPKQSEVDGNKPS